VRVAPLSLSHLGLALALVVCTSCAGDPPPPNVLLITIDTLRADRLGHYGYGRDTSPNLDQLARAGVAYSDTLAPRAKTTPSIASLMTGLYPHGHGVRDLASPLAGDVPTLAEALGAHGYRTGAIIGNWVLTNARSGLARGFDVWCEALPDINAVPPDGAPERKARSLTNGALAALGLADAPADGAGPTRGALLGERPWFLWLHYMDPHGAYDAPAEHRIWRSSEADPIPEHDASEHPLHRHRVAAYNAPPSTRLPDGRIDANQVRDLYDAEIRYVDSELGRLFAALRSDARLKNTLVIVTSDHGESLGEQRYWFEHGLYAYESTVRVPLIVARLDGASTPNERASALTPALVSLADLAPSLLAALGAPATLRAGQLAGRTDSTLLDPRAAARERAEPVFCEKVERADLAGAVQIKAVRAAGWKLIQRYTSRKGESGAGGAAVLLSEELYDLRSDPLEARNLIDAPPREAPLVVLRRELGRFVAADPDLGSLGEVLRRQREGLEQEDQEAARILRALGY